jgi:hypothetical protein
MRPANVYSLRLIERKSVTRYLTWVHESIKQMLLLYSGQAILINLRIDTEMSKIVIINYFSIRVRSFFLRIRSRKLLVALPVKPRKVSGGDKSEGSLGKGC